MLPRVLLKQWMYKQQPLRTKRDPAVSYGINGLNTARTVCDQADSSCGGYRRDGRVAARRLFGLAVHVLLRPARERTAHLCKLCGGLQYFAGNKAHDLIC